MTDTSIYNDIANRTGGEIYIGVVGPVRTGKSTFIKNFLDKLVIPNMENEFAKTRTLDELPQSAAGKTVMTTEPKFVPNDAAHVVLPSGTSFNVKMIDCVGYIVPGALGLYEDEKPRMVKTAWSDEPIPFEEAAKIGTDKVIREHSTVGVVITTDASFSELDRAAYELSEESVINEMKSAGKPFTIVLNSQTPDSDEAKAIAESLSQKHGIPVVRLNCLDMTEDDIIKVLEGILYEFPITELVFSIPSWVRTLSSEHPLRMRITEGICEMADTISRLSEVQDAFSDVFDDKFGTGIHFDSINLADGTAKLDISVPRELFYKILGDETGLEISSDEDLIEIVTSLSASKQRYAKFEDALKQVEETGYGIVTPCIEDMTLEEPEIVKQAGSYGVKLRASAPSIHLMRADIKAEVSPIVGSEKQSEDIVKYLLHEFEEDPTQIWESNLFGKSLHDLMGESIGAKLNHMPVEARSKLCDTLGKIINDGAGGLICILL
ncbi:MAG: stage IV sporulation protein A [Ruminococcaceae bacterium]|nr:stage IV sporulation protein A [Oscillospiraceae bacterium]